MKERSPSTGFKFQETATSYALSLPVKTFRTIVNRDSSAIDKGRKTLLNELMAVDGVSDVEYNGHFGSAIYFTLETRLANKATLSAIQEVIVRYAAPKSRSKGTRS